MLRIELVFSPRPRVVEHLSLSLAPGTTLQQALDGSGMLARHCEVNPALLSFSVWGREQPPGYPLRDRDRIEICRPLSVDPKEARRLRYRHQRADAAARFKASTG